MTKQKIELVAGSVDNEKLYEDPEDEYDYYGEYYYG
jgi:hypothetical protein